MKWILLALAVAPILAGLAGLAKALWDASRDDAAERALDEIRKELGQ